MQQLISTKVGNLLRVDFVITFSPFFEDIV